MSGKLIGRVYDIRLPHDEQAIMIALADHGNDFGEHIHPSVDYLAWKTEYDRRNVQRILRKLEDKQLLIPVAFARGGRGRATEYEMHLENGEPKAPFERHTKDGATTALSDDEHENSGADAALSIKKDGATTAVSLEDTKGRHLIHKRAASHTQKGGISYTKGGTHATPTVLEPLYEPSEETAHTRDTPFFEKKSGEPEPDSDPEAESPPVARRPPYDDRAFRRWALAQTGGWANLAPKRLDLMMSEYCRVKGIPS